MSSISVIDDFYTDIIYYREYDVKGFDEKSRYMKIEFILFRFIDDKKVS